MEETKNCKILIWVAVILGVSLLLSFIIGSITAYKIKDLSNTLAVIGSAKKQVTSDSVKWSSSFSRTFSINDLKSGYALMDQDKKRVVEFFKGQVIEEKDLDISPVFIEQQYYQPGTPQEQREYSLRQTVIVQSTDLDKMTALAKNTDKLINEGVIFSPQPLEYYYSKLADLRVTLLGDAVKDAQARAAQIAQSSGKRVGSIKSASAGIVQVMPVNSVEISDYGNYDTSTIEKEVMVTVRANFVLK